MTILEDLPKDTIPSYLLEAVDQQVVAEVESYAASRRNDVKAHVAQTSKEENGKSQSEQS